MDEKTSIYMEGASDLEITDFSQWQEATAETPENKIKKKRRRRKRTSHMPPDKERWDLFRIDTRRLCGIIESGDHIPANCYHQKVEVIPVNQHGYMMLLMQNQSAGNGYWEFLSGYVRSGETATECAIRKIYDETGISANIENLVYVNSVLTPGVLHHNFICCIKDLFSQRIVLQRGERTAYRFATMEEVLRMEFLRQIDPAINIHLTEENKKAIEKWIGKPDKRKKKKGDSLYHKRTCTTSKGGMIRQVPSIATMPPKHISFPLMTEEDLLESRKAAAEFEADMLTRSINKWYNKN